MIIEADIVRHPKFIQLKTLVGDIALEYLARLWAHCQQNKRGQFWAGANANYVEVVITGSSQRGKLFAALRDCRWVHERADGIEIHDWDKHNASLIARWKRAPQPYVDPPVQGSAQQSPQTPVENPDRSGVDRTGQEGRGDAPTLTPSLDEAVAWFERNESGYAKADIEAVFKGFEATKLPSGAWRWGTGEVTDWRMAMSARLLDRYKKDTVRGEARNSGEPPLPAVPTNFTIAQMKI